MLWIRWREEQHQQTQYMKVQKNNTQDSNVVPHRSTNWARQCLTSLSRREAVLSLWYERSFSNGPSNNSKCVVLRYRNFLLGEKRIWLTARPTRLNSGAKFGRRTSSTSSLYWNQVIRNDKLIRAWTHRISLSLQPLCFLLKKILTLSIHFKFDKRYRIAIEAGEVSLRQCVKEVWRDVSWYSRKGVQVYLILYYLLSVRSGPWQSSTVEVTSAYLRSLKKAMRNKTSLLPCREIMYHICWQEKDASH